MTRRETPTTTAKREKQRTSKPLVLKEERDGATAEQDSELKERRQWRRRTRAYTAVRVVELSKEAMPWLEAILGKPSVAMWNRACDMAAINTKATFSPSYHHCGPLRLHGRTEMQ